MVGSISSILVHLNTISSSIKDDTIGSSSVPLNVIISQFLGYASIFCWICVFIPQVYENWVQKSSASVSLAFVFLWAAGDIFNLVGSVAQHLVLTAILLAAYYLASDVILVSQVIYYKYFPGKPTESKEIDQSNEQSDLLSSSSTTAYGSLNINKPTSNQEDDVVSHPRFSNSTKAAIGLFLVLVPGCALISRINHQPLFYHPNQVNIDSGEIGVVWWAALCGWISTFLFCSAKVPQIWLNYTRKSTDGLSMIMFIFCCFGNLTYILSILFYAQDAAYLTRNLPWLAGAALPFIFDFTIFAQYFMYRKNERSSLETTLV